jgi:hypothetical protein
MFNKKILCSDVSINLGKEIYHTRFSKESIIQLSNKYKKLSGQDFIDSNVVCRISNGRKTWYVMSSGYVCVVTLNGIKLFDKQKKPTLLKRVINKLGEICHTKQ